MTLAFTDFLESDPLAFIELFEVPFIQMQGDGKTNFTLGLSRCDLALVFRSGIPIPLMEPFNLLGIYRNRNIQPLLFCLLDFFPIAAPGTSRLHIDSKFKELEIGMVRFPVPLPITSLNFTTHPTSLLFVFVSTIKKIAN